MCKKILLTIFILTGLNSYGQKGYVDKVNQTNANGQKTGYWIEHLEYGRRMELYYENGVKSGLYKEYSKYGILQYMGEYRDGKMSGIWYDFGDYGHLMFIMKDFVKKDTTIARRDNDGTISTFKNQCYYISYHPNGRMESEGVLLWYEDPWEDTSYEYGLWKYYDDSGKLLKTENFK